MLDLLKEGIMRGLRTSEALSICQKHGIEITKNGLYSAGLVHNFVGRFPKDTHLFYVEARMFEWIMNRKEFPSDPDWIPVAEMAKELGRPKETIYGWIYKKWITGRRFGGPSGRVYCKKSEATLQNAEVHKRRGFGRKEKPAPGSD